MPFVAVISDYEPYEIKTQISEEERAANVREVRNSEKHLALRADLADHICRIDFPTTRRTRLFVILNFILYI